jgi:PAS domain S-box-containing protein
MSKDSKDPRGKTQLLEEVERLQFRLQEAEETLEAIRSADVDALVVAGPQGEQVFSITGAEHIYRVIVETMNEAALTVDPDGTILFCNQRFCDLLKTPIQGTMGRKVTAFVARPQQSPLKTLLTDAQTGPVQRRLTLRAADGTPVPIQLAASPLQVSGGTSICLVATDLTELEASANSIRVLGEHEQAMQEANERLQAQSEELQIRAEELRAQTGELAAANRALRQSEERLRQAQQAGRVGVFDRDLQNNTAVWTPELEELFGIPVGSFEGKPEDWAKRVCPEDLPRMRSFLQEWLQSERTEETWEYRFIRADGQARWMEGRGRIFRDPSGTPLRMIGTNVDITERKRAEEQLHEAHRRLNLHIDNAPLAVVEWDSDFYITRWAGEAVKVFGWTSEEVLGKRIDELPWVYEEDRPGVEQVMADMLSGRRPRNVNKNRNVRKDGTIIYCEWYNSAISGASGRLVSVLSQVLDVTERNQAEEALRESEERLKRAQGIAHLGSWELDLVNHHLSWSDEAYRIFGLQPQEFPATYEAFLEAVHPDDRAAVDAAYSGSLREGRDTYEIEHRIVRRSTGEIRIVHEKCEHLRDASGRIIHSVGMVHDITERKHAEDELRESEERYHRLFEEDLTGDFISTPEGQILLCNPAFATIFGFPSAPEAVGTNIRDLYLDPKEREPLLAQLRQHKRIERFEVWQRRRDGERIYLVENLVGHFNARDELYEVKGYVFDDTERKRAEEALRELTRTLESKVAQRTAELQHRARQLQKLTLELSETEDRERRQLAEILHDDLQQQLAAAKFHLSLLRNRAKHDPSQQALITQVNQMLMDAIQKSRDLSHELSPAVLYHGDFVGALSWMAGQLHAKHGLEVAVDPFGEVSVQSDALKTFLYKAAQELLFNVVKHARVDKARIRVRRLGRCIYLSVSDRGRGFDPQELRQTLGFGLLSIRERIELLGGRMKIHSVKGQGSTFHIVVPDGPMVENGYPGTVGVGLRARPTSEARPDDHGLGGHGGLPLRVLLADDHKIVREGLISLLSEEHDVEVVGEAANGREAVDQAYRLQPDVVIMDVAMPLINGDDATRQIKMHLPQTRVIALSMHDEPDMVEKMRRAGAEGYILKTAPSEELLAAIRGRAHAGVTA